MYLRNLYAPLMCFFSGLLCVMAVPAIAFPFPSHSPRVTHSRSRLGEWNLNVAHDAFSKEVACVLKARNGRAIYRAGAVGFRFGHHRDVGQAVYRIDASEPRASRDDLPELVTLGVPMDKGGMGNATAGIVWVPYSRLVGGSTIAIEASPGRGPITFHFLGLDALRDTAIAQGCSPDSRFVER